MSHVGQYTRDRERKRKRWIDCEVALDSTRRELRVVEDSKVVCKSQLDGLKLSALLQGEDVGIGGLIVRIDLSENAPTALPTTNQQPSQPPYLGALPTKRPQELVTRLKRVELHPRGTSIRSSHPRLPDEFDDSVVAGDRLEGGSSQRLTKAKEWRVPAVQTSPAADGFKEYFYLFSGSLAVSKKLCLKKLKFSTLEEYASHFISAIHESVYQGIYQSLLQVERKISFQSGRVRMKETCLACDLLYLSDIQIIVSDESDGDHRSEAGTGGKRIFMKMSNPLKKEERERMSKGDIWLLWDEDSAFIRPGSSALDKHQRLRDRGYRLPFSEGFLWQNVWAVRSIWFSFSQAGMMQIVDIAGNSSLPPDFGNMPPGKTRGALRQKFNAIKFSCDLTHFYALDFLNDIVGLKGAPLLYRMLGDASAIPAPEMSTGLIRGEKSMSPTVWDGLTRATVDNTLLFILDYFYLNDDQTAVLRRVSDWFIAPSTRTSDVIVVHGVFGSGKSHALAAVLLTIAMLSDGCRKSLVCSNTNVAVDRILSQIVRVLESDTWPQSKSVSSDRIVRVGCAAKVDVRLRKHLVLQADSIVAAKNDLLSAQNLSYDAGYETLLKEIEQKEFMGNQRNRLNQASIIGTTCASSITSLLHDMRFDVLVLDEASQITEPTALLPIATSRATKLIIVGDPKQLSPIITDSRDSCQLGVTLFDRLMSNDWPYIVMRTQYRCHPDIAEICNRLYYNGVIQHGVRSHYSADGVSVNIPTVVTITFDGAECRDQTSAVNMTELNLLRDLLHHILEIWGQKVVVGVICFYRPQMQLALKLLAPFLEELRLSRSEAQVKVSTIDAYQGQENDISIILTTRAEETSFLSDAKRVNVAISRSKHHLIILGQRSLFESSVLWKSIATSGVIVQSLSCFIKLTNTGNKKECMDNYSQHFSHDSATVTYKMKSTQDIEESICRLRRLKEAKLNLVHLAPSSVPSSD